MKKYNNRYYYSLNNYLQDRFDEKIFKVSLDGGFTCPNRDGTLGYGGCIFCNEIGSGDFSGNKVKNITQQIDEQLEFLKNKIKNRKVMAYFQNFTSTYASVDYLEKIYYEALSHPRVIGICIGTRPDCIDKNILELLNNINKKYFLWIELGLQTSNENTAKLINRCYPLSTYINTTKMLNKYNIKFVTHMIVGLPYENRTDIYNTVQTIIQANSWGIKIHSLYILKNTGMFNLYKKTNFNIFSLNEYIDIVVSILNLLPENMVVHRLTGDADKNFLVEPKWSLNKRNILNLIEKQLKINHMNKIDLK